MFHSGTIVGITNGFGNIPGWLAPLTAGAFTQGSVIIEQFKYCYHLPDTKKLIYPVILGNLILHFNLPSANISQLEESLVPSYCNLSD